MQETLVIWGFMLQVFCVGRLVRKAHSDKDQEKRSCFPISFHTLHTPNWLIQTALVATCTDVISSHREPKSHPS